MEAVQLPQYMIRQNKYIFVLDHLEILNAEIHILSDLLYIIAHSEADATGNRYLRKSSNSAAHGIARACKCLMCNDINNILGI